MITTYAQLQSAIADELNRTDLDAVIPTFISLCESQTERQLRCRQMQAKATLTFGSPISVPDDFLESRAVYLDTDPKVQLNYETADLVLTGMTYNAYTVYGDAIEFSEDHEGTATLLYYQRLPRLSDVNTSNWLLDRHEDIYFYGALMNSAPYLKEDPRIAVWGQLYQNAVNSLKMQDERSRTQSFGLTQSARTFG